MPPPDSIPRCPICRSVLPDGCGPLLCPACALEAPFSPGAADDAPENTRQLGDYTLLHEIGRGGMGIVYQARQEKLKRLVAVKILPGASFSSGEFRRQFQREAEAAARLRHPGIVAVHEIGEHRGQPFLVMELVTGPSLADRLKKARLSPETAALLVRDVARAVAHAHAHDVVHRDIKPSNILLDGGDHPRLTDFGLARFTDTEVTRMQLADAIGSPAYLPPERTSPATGPASASEDVYSLGAVLYHCLTGRPPFAADSLPALLAAIGEEEPVPPRRLNRSVPIDLETVCLRCLAKKPAARYAGAGELAQELERVLRQQPVLARPVGPAGRLLRWSRRHPATAALSVALILAIFGGTLTSLLGWRAAVHNARQAEASAETRRVELYSGNLSAASSAALKEGNPAQARAFLQDCIPASGETDLRGPEWYLLSALLRPQSVFSVQAHAHIITSLSWNPAGDRLLSASHDGSLRLWRLCPGTTTLTPEGEVLPPGRPRLQQVQWLPDGSTFLASEQNQYLRLRVPGRTAPLWEIPGCQFAFSADASLLATSTARPFSNDPAGRVSLWRLSKKAPPVLLETFPQSARAVTLSPNGRYLAFALAPEDRSAPERHVLIVDLATRATRSVGTSGPVWTLQFTPDSAQLAVTLFAGGTDVLRFSADTGTALAPLEGHALRPWSVTFSSRKNQIITTSSDRSIRSWAQTDGTPTGQIANAHENEIWCAALDPHGTLLATGDKDGVLKLFSFPLPPSPLAQFPRLPHFRYALPVFKPDSSGLVTSTQPLVGYDFAGQAISSPPVAVGPPANILRGGLSTGGRFYFAVQRSGSALRVNLADGSTARAPDLFAPAAENTDPLNACALSPDGRFLALASWSELVLHDFKTGSTRRFPNDRHWARAIAFTPDGRLMATAGIDGRIVLRNLADGTIKATLLGHLQEASGLAFSPDGRTLVSSEIGRGLRFWRMDTLREVLSLPIPDATETLVFSQDGRQLALVLCPEEAPPEAGSVIVLACPRP